jgi:hypothetical protein
MKTNQAYHFIGLDIHKRTIAFCEKDPLGDVADRGTLLARKEELVAFATSRGINGDSNQLLIYLD